MSETRRGPRRTIPDLLADPSGEALSAPGRPAMDFAGLRAQVERCAGALAALGLGPGSAVAIVLPNGPEMAATFLGAAACATAAPLNPAYTESEFRFYLEDLGAEALILAEGAETPARAAAEGLGVRVIELRAEDRAGAFALMAGGASVEASEPRWNGPEDAALVLHTSGTTSRPKIVPLSAQNLCASAEAIADTLRLSPQDRCLNVMPLFHIHGLVAALLASLSAGASVACAPGFDGLRFFRWLEEMRPTWWTAVPTMHQAILARAPRNAEIVAAAKPRFIRSSSASLPVPTLRALEEAFGAPVIEAYGMTEAAHQMASNPLPPAPRKPGTVGLAAGPEIAVMAEDGRLLPAHETGEIVIRGENVTAGYARNAEANARAFKGGWFLTGDQGHLDAEGYLTISGRLKEIINRGGEKVAPKEVDDVLVEHPAVAQAVTFALPHRALGEEVAAAIVLREGAQATAQELRLHAAERLAPFKVPREFVFLDEIPKGATGKLQRIGLAEKLGLAPGIEA